MYWHFQISIVSKCRQQVFQPQETLLHLPHPAGRAHRKYIERHHQNQTQQDRETKGDHSRVPTTTSWCAFSGCMCYSVVVRRRLCGGTFHFLEATVENNTLQCCILLFPHLRQWTFTRPFRFRPPHPPQTHRLPLSTCIKQKFRWSRVGH